MAKFQNVFLPLRATLRSQLIHNDGNDHNIISDAQHNVAGVIDLGDMSYSSLVVEVAVTIAYGW